MLDINLLRTNPDLVRENIRKKFQDAKLPLVKAVPGRMRLDRASAADKRSRGQKGLRHWRTAR